jgi:1-acyl-sn-glycerol-3-phosphate acyltransferase
MLSDAQTNQLSIGVLVVFALTLLACLYGVYRGYRESYTVGQFPIYMLQAVMTRVLWRTEVEGRIPIGLHQGAVVVSNHIGPIDPAFIECASGRPLHWMVAKEYCEHPLFGWAFRILQVIPVNRSGIDTAATKLAVRYASQGELVGMFPEGRINETSALLLPGRPGAALIALRAKVPIVPCYVSGSPYDGTIFGFFFIPAKARVKIGQAIDITEYLAESASEGAGNKEVLQKLTRRLLIEIARLAGAENFEPELAGRSWKPVEANGD